MQSDIAGVEEPWSSTASTAPRPEYLGRRARFSVTKSRFSALSQRLLCFVSIVSSSLPWTYTKEGRSYCDWLSWFRQSQSWRYSSFAPLYFNSACLLTCIGIVNKTYKIEEWASCLAAMKDKSAIKAAIVFDWIRNKSLQSGWDG